jgi:hypothetical protein
MNKSIIFTFFIFVSLSSYAQGYKYIEKVWSDAKEDNLKIVPSILEPFDSEFVLYITNKGKFFFEHGIIHLYTEDIKKRIYRKVFIEIIRYEAITNLKRFYVESDYYRKPL